jgi:pantoate--beta-alanine ligase
MTEVVRTISEWRRVRETLRSQEKTIGFVPTMGALHPGHYSLVERSVTENEVTVASIFVNPTQFNDPKDLKNYPITFEEDVEGLSHIGCDYCFSPKFEDLYPDNYRFKVSECEVSKMLCGAHREGHFDGVLTVVLKLFNIIQADRAYFGEKDYQQLHLITEMVSALFLSTEIVPCPTVREEDGLAMSSRNRRLEAQDRKLAPEFAKILRASESSILAKEKLQNLGFDVDYVEEHFGRRFGAVTLGGVRLIDNVAR